MKNRFFAVLLCIVMLSAFQARAEYRDEIYQSENLISIYSNMAIQSSVWINDTLYMLGDSLRGTEGILTDLYDQPENVLALVEKITDYAIEDTIKGAENAESPYIWFWLHKGVDSFMSDEMYKKFYWPTLQRYIVALTENNLVPVVYCEGAYNTRFDYLKDVPKGKVIYDFEEIDMVQAKKELKDVACIAGNLPNYLLSYGTAEQIDEYIKKLFGECAGGGGFMFDTGALIDDAKFENFEAMYNAADKYGRY